MTEDVVVSVGLDTSVPNGARIYDYLLGGRQNYVADRLTAQGMLDVNPAAWVTAKANRAFLGRAVRIASEAGVRQFLDIGSGLPTQRNVHEVAQDIDPTAATVYVDNDPQVLVHARAILGPREGVAVVAADVRDPAEVLDHPDTRRLLDFDRPIALLLVAVLHFVDDATQPHALVAQLRERLAPGSLLILSHSVQEGPRAVEEAALDGFRQTATPLHPRTRAEIEQFFDGFELLEPGLVDVHRWRPDGEAEEGLGSSAWVLAGGVGRLARVPEPRGAVTR